MRLVATSAAFKTHGPVLEGKRTALVAVAGEAAGFVAGEPSCHLRPDAPVGVVTVHATHGFLRKPVVIRALELRPNLEMTARALLVDRGGLAHDEPVGPALVDFVARCARDRIFGVAALQTSDVGRLVQMATEANAIRGRRRQFRRVADGGGVRRIGVLLAGAVTGFAGMSGRTSLLICVDQMVRALREGACDVFVASAARVRSGVRRGWLRPCWGHSQSQANQQ